MLRASPIVATTSNISAKTCPQIVHLECCDKVTIVTFYNWNVVTRSHFIIAVVLAGPRSQMTNTVIVAAIMYDKTSNVFLCIASPPKYSWVLSCAQYRTNSHTWQHFVERSGGGNGCYNCVSQTVAVILNNLWHHWMMKLLLGNNWVLVTPPTCSRLSQQWGEQSRVWRL